MQQQHHAKENQQPLVGKAHANGNNQHESVVHRCPILALRYHGAAPMPHSPVRDPTPDQMFEQALERRAREAQEVAAVNAEKRDEASVLARVGGVITTAVSAVGNAVHNLHGTTERAVRDREHKLGEEKLALNFPELVSSGDRFVVQYDASVMTKGKAVPGHILLTTRHLCFVNATMKDAILLDTIVSIQPSVALKTFHEGMLYLMPVPKNYVVPDSIQIFLADHRVLQFLDFDTVADKASTAIYGACRCRSIDLFYNWIDHQWRRAVRVPVEGVQYTHAARFHADELHHGGDELHHQQQPLLHKQEQHHDVSASLGGQRPLGAASSTNANLGQQQPQQQVHTVSSHQETTKTTTTGAATATAPKTVPLASQQTATLGAQREVLGNDVQKTR